MRTARIVCVELCLKSFEFIESPVYLFNATNVIQVLFILPKLCVQLAFPLIELVDKSTDFEVGEEIADMIFIFVCFCLFIVTDFFTEEKMFYTNG